MVKSCAFRWSSVLCLVFLIGWTLTVASAQTHSKLQQPVPYFFAIHFTFHAPSQFIEEQLRSVWPYSANSCCRSVAKIRKVRLGWKLQYFTVVLQIVNNQTVPFQMVNIDSEMECQVSQDLLAQKLDSELVARLFPFLALRMQAFRQEQIDVVFTFTCTEYCNQQSFIAVWLTKIINVHIGETLLCFASSNHLLHHYSSA